MSDTCIVCLGDLHAPDPPPPLALELSTTLDPHAPSLAATSASASDSPPAAAQDEFIAHILPCGHNLHDSCLRPWVERANSCPICRTTFHMVELRKTLHGPTVSSYAVEDKAQVADVDPSAFVDDDSAFAEDNIEACMVCDAFGDESLLLLCDGCNQSCHVFCAGLDSVPTGAWFCYDCQADPQVWVHTRPQPARRATIDRRGNQRSRGSRPRNTHMETGTTWARLWRSVASRTDIDLEFPFEDENPLEQQRADAEQRELREWQRRFRVAARAAGPGAANRFRGIAPPNQPQPVDPESQEEIKAWNAFEKARILLEDTETRASKKRKSRASSPEAEERPPEPPRKRKRPRTLRTQDGESASEARAPAQEPSRTTTRNSSISAPQALPSRADTSTGPTFLQSLLDEVDHVAVNRDGVFYDINGELFPFGTERSASPDSASPASGQATPRSMTPPPLRPVSPVQLTSYISPIFPPAPEILPNSKIQADSIERARSRQRAHLLPRSPAISPTRNDTSPGPSSPTSPVSSPKPTMALATATTTTHHLGIKTKSEVQALVKVVLKPYYRNKSITADEYTDINMTICRKLYEQIGTEENFLDKEKWQNVAKEEVERAVSTLKPDPIIKAEPASKPDVTVSALPIRGS